MSLSRTSAVARLNASYVGTLPNGDTEAILNWSPGGNARAVFKNAPPSKCSLPTTKELVRVEKEPLFSL